MSDIEDEIFVTNAVNNFISKYPLKINVVISAITFSFSKELDEAKARAGRHHSALLCALSLLGPKRLTSGLKTYLCDLIKPSLNGGSEVEKSFLKKGEHE